VHVIHGFTRTLVSRPQRRRGQSTYFIAQLGPGVSAGSLRGGGEKRARQVGSCAHRWPLEPRTVHVIWSSPLMFEAVSSNSPQNAEVAVNHFLTRLTVAQARCSDFCVLCQSLRRNVPLEQVTDKARRSGFFAFLIARRPGRMVMCLGSSICCPAQKFTGRLEPITFTMSPLTAQAIRCKAAAAAHRLFCHQIGGPGRPVHGFRWDTLPPDAMLHHNAPRRMLCCTRLRYASVRRITQRGNIPVQLLLRFRDADWSRYSKRRALPHVTLALPASVCLALISFGYPSNRRNASTLTGVSNSVVPGARCFQADICTSLRDRRSAQLLKVYASSPSIRGFGGRSVSVVVQAVACPATRTGSLTVGDVVSSFRTQAVSG